MLKTVNSKLYNLCKNIFFIEYVFINCIVLRAVATINISNLVIFEHYILKYTWTKLVNYFTEVKGFFFFKQVYILFNTSNFLVTTVYFIYLYTI